MTTKLSGLILIVDDTPANLDTISTVLGDAGYEIAIATSGEKALQLLQRRSPDLILLDVRMPGIDGFETCDRIKANSKTCDIPIVFMTSLIDLNNKIKGFNCGAVDYISKPFQEQEILARVKTHIQLRLLTQNLEQQVAEQTASLRIANEALANANISKRLFLSTMSQEIRTPIDDILRLTERLQEQNHGILDGQQIDDLARIEYNGNHLQSLINNTLKLANIESGQLKLDLDLIAVADLCRSCLVAIQSLADRKNIRLILNIEPNLPQLSIDESQMRQAILNLLNNAVKFTDAGSVTLSVTKAMLTNSENISCVRIAITDTGIGITSENIQQLFQPFVQITNLLGERHEGNGLGLILAKQLVELHGGQISVYSIENAGSCFTIELPARDLPQISPTVQIPQLLTGNDWALSS
ncbi:hybrid sensor histidine kinase/response regulator [Chamaesiphon sp. OTE_75_metabat_556]|uniref:hybrid sensor histidine kinase/response regulator n=1 Tax=Chamaesiphon sp. OTE_75_metabat_556 TaxID=2964692 RepID=UPI00286A33C6|nr:hybrid sensor histidine kinase/response regulator [Chamaesiphon sp. OTE_75_metabat_556]